MGELLVLLVIGVFLWLINVVLPIWAQRQQRDAARDAASAGVPPVPPGVLRPQPPRPARQAGPRRQLVPAAPLAVVRQRAPLPLGNRRDMRRAIVLITVLGPCRAFGPPDPAP